MVLKRKFRRRYIAFELKRKVERKPLLEELRGFLASTHPNFDQSTLKLIHASDGSNRGLIRCGHLQVGVLKDSLQRAWRKHGVKILGVSGTIKKAKKKFCRTSEARTSAQS